MSARRKEACAAIAVLLLAGALRLFRLGQIPFEVDELYTLRDAADFGASSSGPGIAGRPLYYLLQHLLLQVLPPTPFMLRLPALVFGLAGVWVTLIVVRRLFGPAGAIVGAALVALSPWHLHASQSARYWTLVYLLAVLAMWFLVEASTTDRAKWWLAALGTMVLGTLTHPTFLFPMLGVLLAPALTPTESGVTWRWPSRHALTRLWIPFAVFLAAEFLFLRFTGNQAALRNLDPRGTLASLRLIPAMVQWANPAVVAAGAVSAVMLLRDPSEVGRRWGVMTLAGVLSGGGLLLAASFRTGVYADYGMSMLPLVFVAVGGATQRVTEQLAGRRLAAASAVALVLGAAMLPSTASHLSSGTRFDYRPSYSEIQRRAPDHLVVGWPIVLQQRYAPQLEFLELKMDPTFFHRILATRAGFWLVASYRRYGLVLDEDGVIAEWIDHHCITVLSTEPPRWDYRRYRVALHWCGTQEIPEAA